MLSSGGGGIEGGGIDPSDGGGGGGDVGYRPPRYSADGTGLGTPEAP
jgi:hypothetical protein